MIVPPTGLRNWLLGRNDLRRSQSEADLQRESEKESREEPPPPGEPAKLWRIVKDGPRSISTLVPAPR